jgi:hypothetical protein
MEYVQKDVSRYMSTLLKDQISRTQPVGAGTRGNFITPLASSRTDEAKRNLIAVSSFLNADVGNSFVLEANRDCVAVLKKKQAPATGHILAFAFRGTAIAEDLVVDAKLAANSKKIVRLDEARVFVRNILRQHVYSLTTNVLGVDVNALEFYGHSLGGFIGINFFFFFLLLKLTFPPSRRSGLRLSGISHVYVSDRCAVAEPRLPLCVRFQ